MDIFMSLVFKILAVSLILLYAFVFLKFLLLPFKDKFSPVKKVTAQISDKFEGAASPRLQASALKTPAFVVVFDTGKKKLSFTVSEYSYNTYRLNQKGTLMYKGSKLIDFK